MIFSVMKSLIFYTRLLLLLLAGKNCALAQNVNLHWSSPVKQRYVTFYAEPSGTPPDEMAVLVQSKTNELEFWKRLHAWENEVRTNHNLLRTRPFPPPATPAQPDFGKAVWVPFQTNLSVDLGPGDGARELWVSFRNRGYRDIGWNAHDIAVQSSPPILMITNPPARVTSQPLIQLQGFISSDLAKTLLYQVFNQNHVQTSAGEGLATDRYFDQDLFDFTTNYFTCFDLPLNPGTNTIVLRGTDRAGYSFATNFVIVFTTVGDTNPPVFKLRWLHDGMSISGSQFDLDGPCDDPTAVVTALLFNDQGVASHLNGFVERNGCLWVEEVPVTAGRNYITVVATDAAGNSSFTNLMFSKSSMTLYMDPVPDPNKLWQPKITVTGYCSLTNCVVFRVAEIRRREVRIDLVAVRFFHPVETVHMTAADLHSQVVHGRQGHQTSAAHHHAEPDHGGKRHQQALQHRHTLEPLHFSILSRKRRAGSSGLVPLGDLARSDRFKGIRPFLWTFAPMRRRQCAPSRVQSFYGCSIRDLTC